MSHEYFHVVSMEAAEVKIIQLQERISALEAENARLKEYEQKTQGVNWAKWNDDHYNAMEARIAKLERVASAARNVRAGRYPDRQGFPELQEALAALDAGDTP